MTTPTRETTALNRAVAAQIRSLLGVRMLRQSQLATRMGVTEVWLSRRLREVQPMSLDDVERIAQALEVTPAELIASAVKGPWQPTAEYFDRTVRPSDTRPKGGPRSQSRIGPPNGASPVRHSRHRGTPLAVANPSRMA
jgi:transcriptional regulator with XRE-family HTH domain